MIIHIHTYIHILLYVMTIHVSDDHTYIHTYSQFGMQRNKQTEDALEYLVMYLSQRFNTKAYLVSHALFRLLAITTGSRAWTGCCLIAVALSL